MWSSPGHPDRQRAPLPVQHVESRVGDRMADRRLLAVHAPAEVRRGVDRGLRRAVAVEQPIQPRSGRRPAARQLPRAAVTADAHHPQRGQVRRQAGEDRRRQHRVRDLFGADALGERLGRQALLARGDAQRGPGRQRHPGLQDRGVEAERHRLQHPAPRGHPEVAHRVPDQVHRGPVLDQHAVRAAGRPRGEDHIGQVATLSQPVRGRRARSGREARPQDYHPRLGLGQRRQQRFLGEQHRDPGVVEHPGQALPRMGRIERQVAATGLEHAENRHHALDPLLGADTDQHLRPHTQRAELRGQRLALRVELAIGQAAVLESDGGRLWLLPRPDLELLVQAAVFLRYGRIVPVPENLAAFALGQQRQLRERPIRVRGGSAQQDRQVTGEAVDRGGVEEIGGVLDAAQDLSRSRVDDGQQEVGLRRAARDRQRLQVEAGLRGRRRGGARQGQHHLVERRAGQAALDPQLVNQALEGEVLVGVGLQRHRAGVREQLAERLLRRRPAAHHQGVHEEADQPFDLGAVPIRHRRAEQQVALAGVAEEQGLQPGERRHEEGDPLAPGEGAQPLRGFRGDLQRAGAAAEPLHRRPRPVGRQLQDRRSPLQRPLPEGDLPLQHVALQPLPLPDGEVRVLHRQRRQVRRTALQRGLVELQDSVTSTSIDQPSVMM